MTFLHASAGFGKSTLAMQWLEKSRNGGTRVAWLSLDEKDSQIGQFLAYLISALAEAGVEIGDFEEIFEGSVSGSVSEVEFDSVFTNLVASIANDAVKTIIILDDYHKLHSPEADKLVGRLIAVMPEFLHLLISSQQRPWLPFAELYAQGNLQELTSADLSFTIDETRAMLSGVIEPDDIPILYSRTEGWPVASQLALAHFSNSDHGTGLIDTFTGRTLEVCRYFEEKIFVGLSEELREFLIRISILQQFNKDIADFVLDKNDSQFFLDSLLALDSFLFLSDGEGFSYRLHPMLLEYLRGQLERRHRTELKNLHLRASKWYAENRLLLAAVKHAQMAGEKALAARLVEDWGGWELIYSEGVSFVSELLETFGANLTEYPRLALCKVMHSVKLGDLAGAQSLYERVKRSTNNFHGVSEEPDEALMSDGGWIGLELDCVNDTILTDSGARRLMELQRTLTHPSPDQHVFLLIASAMVSFSRGDFASATAAVNECLGESEAINRPFESSIAVFSVLYRGFIQMLQADFTGAMSQYNDVIERAAHIHGAAGDFSGVAQILSAEIYYQRDDFDSASKALESNLGCPSDHDCWTDVYISGYQTAVSLACATRNYPEAFDWIQSGFETAETRGLVRLKDLLEALKYRINVYAKNVKEASWARNKVSSYEIGRWKKEPMYWRHNYAWGIATAEHDITLVRPNLALDTLSDLELCCRHFGANLFLIEVLFFKGHALQLQGKRDMARSHLLESLRLAGPQNIRRIFLNKGYVFVCLVEECLADSMEEFESAGVLDFASGLLEAHKATGESVSHASTTALTHRERHILTQLYEGCSNKAIARALGITDNTVKYHLKNIYTKLNVVNRRDAIALGRQRGMLD
ncbi:MAG: LuxR C-terminal-related transcriptional regulator [Pseudomonadota bacterium]|nr:LuxR C-terminal-related transcriptional regulator [Pseudomonadota bacterium]